MDYYVSCSIFVILYFRTIRPRSENTEIIVENITSAY